MKTGSVQSQRDFHGNGACRCQHQDDEHIDLVGHYAEVGEQEEGDIGAHGVEAVIDAEVGAVDEAFGQGADPVYDAGVRRVYHGETQTCSEQSRNEHDIAVEHQKEDSAAENHDAEEDEIAFAAQELQEIF